MRLADCDVTYYDTAVLVTYFSVLAKVLQCGLLVGKNVANWFYNRNNKFGILNPPAAL